MKENVRGCFFSEHSVYYYVVTQNMQKIIRHWLVKRHNYCYLH